ncbi:MAG: cell division protein FtsQ/DivIB [Roseovarius sp.]|nr:cell division protein FtsQ/DivIB [Roseovarius sp.]
MQQVGPKADPAPSRLRFRLERLMLTPLFRLLLRAGLPFAAVFLLGAAWLSDEARQERLLLAVSELRQTVETRPEFMVRLLEVEGASAPIEEEIREIFPYEFPVSSFDMDLDALQETVAGLAPVVSASLRIRQGGVLVAEIDEREPAALWRRREGLGVVDRDGVLIAEVAARADRPGLPVVAGGGADAAIPEALAILQAARPLRDRLRGLVRVGERRWDVVLTRDQRIMLPERDAVRALERVIVLDQVQDMLERDVVAVDMRLAERPTIRMRERAVEDWWRVKNTTTGAGQ